MKTHRLVALLFPLLLATPATAQSLDADFAERFGRLALECVHQEYPNKIAHVLAGDGDVRPPRELTPAFYGCYDWHSAVHGHWLLARLARSFPDSPVAGEARQALAESLTAENIAAEVRYLEGPGRVSFERPYGLAWLLQLAAELRQWDDPQARGWAEVLAPLERSAAERLRQWIPKLTHPIRIGEHSQTAFAFGLIVDWARIAGDYRTEGAVRRASFRFYLEDRACPLAYEPSGHDFLSPCLAEADLMRRFDLDYDGAIVIDISDRHGVPNQARNVVNVPAGRLREGDDGSGFGAAGPGLSLVHEITHVVAASAYRPDRFYDDGLAVYLQSRFGTASSFPDFGRDLHRETAALGKEVGSSLPLAEADRTRRWTDSQELRRLAYLQQGSFTRFLIERDGIELYLRVYRGESLAEAYGQDLATLEAEWRALLADL